MGRPMVPPPAVPFGKFCAGNDPFAGSAPRAGGIGSLFPGLARRYPLTRRSPQGWDLSSIVSNLAPLADSLMSLWPQSQFIGKGNEADPSYFSAPNSTVKSGFWLSKTDRLVGGADVVHYKNEDQDVYIGIDVEYLQFDKKPADYLDVGVGAVGVDCAFNLRKYFVRIQVQ
jgi:hypothetical protein